MRLKAGEKAPEFIEGSDYRFQASSYSGTSDADGNLDVPFIIPFPVQVNGGDRPQVGTFGGGKQFANCIGPGRLPSDQRTVQRF